VESLTARAEAECSDYNFGYLAAELKGIETGDLSDLKEELESSIKESKDNELPYV
jgi:hypothetical protein